MRTQFLQTLLVVVRRTFVTSVIGILFLALTMPGCARKAEESLAKKEIVTETVAPNPAEKLMQEQIAIYDQMTDVYNEASEGEAKLNKRQRIKITGLEEKLYLLKQAFEACAEDQKQAAATPIKKELNESIKRYRDAKLRDAALMRKKGA